MRLEQLRAVDGTGSDRLAASFFEFDVAHEELRVAEEEWRCRQAKISERLAAQQRVWARVRVVASARPRFSSPTGQAASWSRTVWPAPLLEMPSTPEAMATESAFAQAVDDAQLEAWECPASSLRETGRLPLSLRVADDGAGPTSPTVEGWLAWAACWRSHVPWR